MRLIITHGGAAHRDEFVAVCVAMAKYPEVPVLRRDPTVEELDDPAVLVLDVGGRHEPCFANFDHHQFGRDEAPTCALQLYLEWLGVWLLARQASRWLEVTSILDSRGPFALAKHLGISQEALSQLLSPVEHQVLQLFSRCEEVSPDSELHVLMKQLGEQWLEYWHELAERWTRLKEVAELVTIDGVPGVALTAIGRDEHPTLALEPWCEAMDEDVAFTVTQDDRGDGWCLFRRNDHPRVDFSRLQGDPAIVFAHKGGFVAKTAREADWKDLVRRSLVREEV